MRYSQNLSMEGASPRHSVCLTLCDDTSRRQQVTVSSETRLRAGARSGTQLCQGGVLDGK